MTTLALAVVQAIFPFDAEDTSASTIIWVRARRDDYITTSMTGFHVTKCILQIGGLLVRDNVAPLSGVQKAGSKL